MKKNLIFAISFMVFIAILFLNINIANAESEDIGLQSISFTGSEINLDEYALDDEITIPTSISVTGEPKLVSVIFRCYEMNEFYGPFVIYANGTGKIDLELNRNSIIKGKTYELTDIFVMKDDESKHYVTPQSNEYGNDEDAIDYDYSFSFVLNSDWTENTNLINLEFQDNIIDIDKGSTTNTTLEFEGNVDMVSVAFNGENGEKLGPILLYYKDMNGNDVYTDMGFGGAKLNTIYYLSDVFFMKNVGNHQLLKHYSANKSQNYEKDYDVYPLDIEYSAKVYSSWMEKTKLNSIKIDSKKVDFSTININDKYRISTDIDFDGDVDEIVLEFESTNGEKYGYVTIYTKEDGKKDLVIENEDVLKEGETYYLTNIYLRKKINDNLTLSKAYATRNSELQINDYSIIDFDYDYEFKVTNLNNRIKDIKVDNTTAKGTLPQTGSMESIIIISTVANIAIIGGIILIKTRKIKEI